MSVSLTLVTILMVIGLALLVAFSRRSIVPNPINRESSTFNPLIALLPLIIWSVLAKYLGVTHSLFVSMPKMIIGVLIVTIVFYFSGKK